MMLCFNAFVSQRMKSLQLNQVNSMAAISTSKRYARLALEVKFNFLSCMVLWQRVQYFVNLRTRQCYKQPLNDTFRPIEVPYSAKFIDKREIGSNAVVGAGVEVDLWAGDTDGRQIFNKIQLHISFEHLQRVADTLEHGPVLAASQSVISIMPQGIISLPACCKCITRRIYFQ